MLTVKWQRPRLAALALTLASLACSVGQAVPTEPPPAPTAEPTPVVEPVATDAPTIIDIPAPDTSSEVSYYVTEFDDVDEWYSLSVPETNNFAADVDRSKLFIGVYDPDTSAYMFYDFYFENPDIEIVAQVETVGGPNRNNISVVCRATDQGWYEFSLNSGGLWYIWLYDYDDGYTSLAEGGSTAIHMQKDSNLLAARCEGKELSLFINDTFIGSATDTRIREGGYVGVSATTFDVPGAEVEFDWFTATPME